MTFSHHFSVTRNEADKLLSETTEKPEDDHQAYTVFHSSTCDEDGKPRLNALISSKSKYNNVFAPKCSYHTKNVLF